MLLLSVESETDEVSSRSSDVSWVCAELLVTMRRLWRCFIWMRRSRLDSGGFSPASDVLFPLNAFRLSSDVPLLETSYNLTCFFSFARLNPMFFTRSDDQPGPRHHQLMMTSLPVLFIRRQKLSSSRHSGFIWAEDQISFLRRDETLRDSTSKSRSVISTSTCFLPQSLKTQKSDIKGVLPLESEFWV